MAGVAMLSKRAWVEAWQDSVRLFKEPYRLTAAVCESSTVANMMRLELK